MILDISGGENITATLSNSNITFITPSNYNGVEAFSINVSDGELLDSENFFVTVNSINDNPIILSSSPFEVNASIGYQYNIEVIDVDGDNLIFSLIGAPDNMTINNTHYKKHQKKS